MTGPGMICLVAVRGLVAAFGADPASPRRGRFASAGDEHGERIAGPPRADADPDVGRGPAPSSSVASCSSVKPSQRSPSRSRTQFSLVLAQIEHQHAAAGHDDARGFGERARGIAGVVQRLRQQATSTLASLMRQLLELAALPVTLRHAAAPASACARFEHRRRSIDRDDARRPAARLDGQIALAAAEVGDLAAAAAGGRAPAPTPPSSGRARAAARCVSGPACASKFSFRSRRTSSSRASSARPAAVRAAALELRLEQRPPAGRSRCRHRTAPATSR